MHNNPIEDDREAKTSQNTVLIPSFEELAELAENDPFEFEALRVRLCSQMIGSAPDALKRRLQGLQFTIDMERKRSKSSYMTCLKISQMMSDSLSDLSEAITNPEEYQRRVEGRRCEVVPLFTGADE